MEANRARKTLHQLIDQTKDSELLTLCVQLLEREARKTSIQETKFFNTSDSDLKLRAEASLASIIKGQTRNIQDFKREVDQWKENRSI